MTEAPQRARGRSFAAAAITLGTLALAIALAVGSARLMGRPLEAPSLTSALFYLIAAGTLAAAAGVALSRNILHSALALLGTLLGVGSLYVWLRADFLAVTQLLVYIGGILVLILFALMLTAKIGVSSDTNPALGRGLSVALCAGLFGLLGALAITAPWKRGAEAFDAASTVERIGELFLGEYLLAFEVASLLLLATLIAAVVVARKEPS